MARGWESKSVEEQQSERKHETDFQRPKLSAAEIERNSQLHTLEMARARVAEQLRRSRNQRYTELLQQELQHLDQQITHLHAA